MGSNVDPAGPKQPAKYRARWGCHCRTNLVTGICYFFYNHSQFGSILTQNDTKNGSNVSGTTFLSVFAPPQKNPRIRIYWEIIIIFYIAI